MFSFSRRKQTIDAAPRIRQIIDATCPNLIAASEQRSARRYNRCIPVVLGEWTNDGPDLEHTGFGFVTDLGDRGFCVLTKFYPKSDQNIIGFFLPNTDMTEPWFFRVNFRAYRNEPQGFIRIGYEVIECLNENFKSQLQGFEQQLYQMLEVEPVAATV